MSAFERWTGREAKALREALRMSQRQFARDLGISDRTITKWESGGASAVPGMEYQAVLDTALHRCDVDARQRFDQAIASRPAQGAAASRFTLAPPLESGLIPRTDYFDELRAMVLAASADGAESIVAIAGPGGFGKTTLASQLSHDENVRAAFPEVVWVETGQDCTPARLVELISDLCFHLDGARPALADPTQAGFHLARILADRRVLLVVDNVWSAEDLAPFLLGAPSCVRLVTTRNVRVCPSAASVFRLGTMSADEVRDLMRRNLPGASTDGLSSLAELCGGWPLLASVVGSAVGHDVRSGASMSAAVRSAAEMLRADGPGAFDVWDTDQRHSAIGHAISASVRSLDEHVTIPGAIDPSARYLELSVFPASTPIPILVLARWWGTAHGWSISATRQFCRLLADRSMISAHLADQDAIVLHDVFVAYLRHQGAEDRAALHRSLLESFRPASGRWADLANEQVYAWRNLAYHVAGAGLSRELADAFSSVDFLAAKVAVCGHQSLVADHQIVSDVQASEDGLSSARLLTGAGYLLYGLSERSDIVATLRVLLAREGIGPPGALGGFDVGWARGADAGAGHIGAVVSTAICGDVLVSGGEDGVVRLWRLSTGAPLHQCRGHTGWVHAAAIAPDGSIVASAGEDTVIRLWDVATGAAVAELAGHSRRIRSLAFSQDGTVLASGAEDGLVCAWDVHRKTMLRPPSTVPVPVWAVAVNGDDSLIAVGGQDEFVRLIRLDDGALVAEAASHRDWVRTVTFGPEPNTLLSGSGDGSVQMWSTDGHELTAARRIEIGTRVRAVTAIPDTGFVISASEDARLRAFTSDGLAAEAAMPAGVDWIRSCARSDDGTVIAGCEDGALRTWRPDGNGRLTVLAAGTNTVWSAAFASEGRRVVLGDGTGLITVEDALSQQRLRTLDAGVGRVWSLATGGAHIAAACGDGAVRVWSLGDETWSRILNERAGRSWAVAVTGAGDRLAASSADGHVRVWNLPAGELVWDVDAKAGRIRSLAFDGAGTTLAAACGDGTARLWDGTGSLLDEVPAVGGWSRAVALDETGTRVAVGAGTGMITVRSVASGSLVAELPGHAGRILQLGFFGDRLLSAAADGTVRLWSLTEQELVAQVRVDASGQCAGFDAASGKVVVASAAGVTSLNIPIVGEDRDDVHE